MKIDKPLTRKTINIVWPSVYSIVKCSLVKHKPGDLDASKARLNVPIAWMHPGQTL